MTKIIPRTGKVQKEKREPSVSGTFRVMKRDRKGGLTNTGATAEVLRPSGRENEVVARIREVHPLRPRREEQLRISKIVNELNQLRRIPWHELTYEQHLRYLQLQDGVAGWNPSAVKRMTRVGTVDVSLLRRGGRKQPERQVVPELIRRKMRHGSLIEKAMKMGSKKRGLAFLARNSLKFNSMADAHKRLVKILREVYGRR